MTAILMMCISFQFDCTYLVSCMFLSNLHCKFIYCFILYLLMSGALGRTVI